MEDPSEPSTSRCRHEAQQPVFRTTRFVCVSDTHNATVKLPKGDVLIHAGDLTNQGSYSELSRAVEWLEKADFEAKIVIAGIPHPPHSSILLLIQLTRPGNHDITLDPSFYASHGSHFHNQVPQVPESCISLLTSSPSITYLNHSSTRVALSSPSGPRTSFTVFGTPYSPRAGLWAFGYDPSESSLWDDIPLDADVVITHTPPHTHRDESRHRRAAGCEALRKALWRVRPRLAVCGHVHEARGAERVTWDLGCANTPYKELATEVWADPGVGARQSLVNLTSKGGRTPLKNDGSRGLVHDAVVAGDGAAAPGIGTRGLGGDAESARSDRAALEGRLGRAETCVVNCAIMAKSWPHVGGKTTNKPIVVDIDLPVWE